MPAVPTQHPAVVLRSHYRQLRALLAIAMIAVVGLSAAVVILADDETTSTRSATPVSAPTEPADGPRYIHPPGQRYDPGPRGTVPTQPRESVPLPARKLDGSTDTPTHEEGADRRPLAGGSRQPSGAEVRAEGAPRADPRPSPPARLRGTPNG